MHKISHTTPVVSNISGRLKRDEPDTFTVVPAAIFVHALPKRVLLSTASSAAFATSYGRPIISKKAKGIILGAGALLIMGYLAFQDIQSDIASLLVNSGNPIPDLFSSPTIEVDPATLGDSISSGKIDAGSVKSTIDPALDQVHLDQTSTTPGEKATVAKKRERLKALANEAVNKAAEAYQFAEKPARELAAAITGDIELKIRLLHLARLGTGHLARTVISLEDVKSKEQFETWAQDMIQAQSFLSSVFDQIADNLEHGSADVQKVFNHTYTKNVEAEQKIKLLVLNTFAEAYKEAFGLIKVVLQ